MNDTTFQRRCERLGERGLVVWLYDELLESGNRDLLRRLEAMSDRTLGCLSEFPFPAFVRKARYVP